MAKFEVMSRYFSEKHLQQASITMKRLRTVGMMAKIAGNARINYPMFLDSRFVAARVNNFLFPGKRSGENTIAIEVEERFAEPITPLNISPRESSAMELRTVLRFIQNLQKYEHSAARVL